MKRLSLIIGIFMVTSFSYSNKSNVKKQKPKVCFSFDDGSTSDKPGYAWNEWNNLLLEKLHENNLQAVFFAACGGLDNEKGKQVLSSWSQHGHLIANHSYSHKSYDNAATTYEFFVADFLRNDSLINTYPGYTKLFRFPYLKEGDTEKKRDDFRAFLKEQGYRNGHVTIDASDWYVYSRMLKRLKENPKANLEPYKKFYLEHIYERAVYYNELSLKLTGRQINHTLLLHHNLTSALFMGDLIALFKAKGWEVVNASEAYKDDIYKQVSNTMPAGESLIWALAKEKGSYENILRYPAEDSKYEEPKMNTLGL